MANGPSHGPRPRTATTGGRRSGPCGCPHPGRCLCRGPPCSLLCRAAPRSGTPWRRLSGARPRRRLARLAGTSPGGDLRGHRRGCRRLGGSRPDRRGCSGPDAGRHLRHGGQTAKMVDLLDRSRRRDGSLGDRGVARPVRLARRAERHHVARAAPSAPTCRLVAGGSRPRRIGRSRSSGLGPRRLAVKSKPNGSASPASSTTSWRTRSR
jgi:hypothetical protein